MVSALVSSDLKAYILEATKTWHGKHELSDCLCDIVLTQEDARNIKVKQFLEFGSQTTRALLMSRFAQDFSRHGYVQ